MNQRLWSIFHLVFAFFLVFTDLTNKTIRISQSKEEEYKNLLNGKKDKSSLQIRYILKQKKKVIQIYIKMYFNSIHNHG